MTETANPTLGKIEDAVERFGMFALLEVGLNALFVAVPFLGNGFFGPILRKLVGFLGEKLFEFIRLHVDLNAIKWVNENHQRDFDRSVVNLKVLARGYGVDSEQFKRERENAKASFARLVRFNGA